MDGSVHSAIRTGALLSYNGALAAAKDSDIKIRQRHASLLLGLALALAFLALLSVRTKAAPAHGLAHGYGDLTGFQNLSGLGAWTANTFWGLDPYDGDAAYLITADAWVQHRRLTGDSVEDACMGHAVDVEGDTAVVGAPRGEDVVDDGQVGAVYVFTRSGPGWSQTAKLTADDSSRLGNRMGSSVAIDGDTIVAGAPGYSEANPPAGWSQSPGAVYVFTKSTSGWSDANEALLKPGFEDYNEGDHVGTSVAIDGDTIVAGAPDVDVRTVADAVITDNAGAAYVFTRPSGGWTNAYGHDACLTAGARGLNDELGTSVAIEGDTVVAGASGADGGQGAAYVFAKEGTYWDDLTHTAKLKASAGGSSDHLGTSVALDNDTVVAGTPGADGGDGAVYVFTKPGSAWGDGTESAELTASDGATSDDLGASVAIGGDTVVAGAPGADSEKGAVYVFTKPGSAWGDLTESARLTASDGATSDDLGASVAVDGGTILAGAPHALLQLEGAAYVFGAPDVALAKSVRPVSVCPGDAITYTLTLTNAGESTATGVVITDRMPISVTSISVVSSGAVITQDANVRYVWGVEDLAPHEGGAITITGVLSEPLAAGTFANTAEIASSSADADAANNTDAATVTVESVGPVAADVTLSTAETDAISCTVSYLAADANGDALSVTDVGAPCPYGRAGTDGTHVTYTPTNRTAGYTATFTYTASDGSLMDTATMTVTVDADNDSPTADDQSATTGEDSNATGTLSADDPDQDDTLSYGVTAQPAYGGAAIDADGDWTYTPTNRTDDYTITFTVTVSDTASPQPNTDKATVTVTVTADNDPPTAHDQSATTGEDSNATGPLCADDPDQDDMLFYGVTAQPAYGSVAIDADGDWTYTPTNRTEGYTVTFTVTVSDTASPQPNTDTAAITVMVTADNDPPTDIQATNRTITENVPSGALVGTLSATDADVNDTHTYTLEITGDCHGPDNDSFTIDGSMLKTEEAFDREAQSTYTICVRTEDGAGNAYHGGLTVDIVDETVDMSVEKMVSDPTPAEDWIVVYTVTVTNHGPDDAKDVIISDREPVSLTFVSARPSQGTYDVSSGVWDADNLSPDVSATLLITAEVEPAGELDLITNTAVISSFDQGDAVPSNNRGDRSIVVRGSQFELTKTVDDATPREGCSFTYTVKLTNDGYTSTAVISDPLSSELAYVDDAPSQGSYDEEIGLWHAGTLGIGETETLHITARPLSGTARTSMTGTTPLPNTATLVGSSRPDPDPADDMASVAVTIQSPDAVRRVVSPDLASGLTCTDTRGLTTTVQVPVEAVTESLTLIYTPLGTPTMETPGGFEFANRQFDLTAYVDGVVRPSYAFLQPITVTIHYSDTDVAGLNEARLAVYAWSGTGWEDAACGAGYDRHPRENWLIVEVCHLTGFALLGRSTPVGGTTRPFSLAPRVSVAWVLTMTLAGAGAIAALSRRRRGQG